MVQVRNGSRNEFYGLAVAGLKAVNVKDAGAGIEPAGGGVASGIEAALFTVFFAHHATEDIKRLRERFVKWVKGLAPEKNHDLERVLARRQIPADLLCPMEATRVSKANTIARCTALPGGSRPR